VLCNYHVTRILCVVFCNYLVTRILSVVLCNYHVTRILFVVLCNCHVTMIYPLCCVIATLPGCICHAVITVSPPYQLLPFLS
jgi:hypothetical protein